MNSPQLASFQHHLSNDPVLRSRVSELLEDAAFDPEALLKLGREAGFSLERTDLRLSEAWLADDAELESQLVAPQPTAANSTERCTVTCGPQCH